MGCRSNSYCLRWHKWVCLGDWPTHWWVLGERNVDNWRTESGRDDRVHVPLPWPFLFLKTQWSVPLFSWVYSTGLSLYLFPFSSPPPTFRQSYSGHYLWLFSLPQMTKSLSKLQLCLYVSTSVFSLLSAFMHMSMLTTTSSWPFKHTSNLCQNSCIHLPPHRRYTFFHWCFHLLPQTWKSILVYTPTRVPMPIHPHPYGQ